jgi:hypothetical protein
MLNGNMTYPKGPGWRGRIENPRTCKKYINAPEITPTQTGLGCLASAVVETEKGRARLGWDGCHAGPLPRLLFAEPVLHRDLQGTGDGHEKGNLFPPVPGL